MNYEQFMRLWYKFCDIWDTDQDEEENKLIEEIENALPFKDKEEHEHWLKVLQGFKFWEDFEELTLSIAQRLDINEQLVDHYWWVAIDLAKKSTFTKLLDTFRELEREWVSKFLDNGYVDTFRMLHENEKEKYTWWSYRTRARERNVGWRLDYFFVNEEFKDNVRASYIISEVMGSDHCPIALEIEI